MTIPGEFFQFPPNPERGQHMTAQERAEDIISQWVGHKISINGQRDDIAAAIEAAVAEERERCAKIAESGQEQFVREELNWNDSLQKWVDQTIGRTAHRIAAAIREPKRGQRRDL